MHSVGLKRLPGDRRHWQRSKSLAEGIVLDAQTLAQLRELAGE
jgi:delta1-piperideine-2-carboxylate reductase